MTKKHHKCDESCGVHTTDEAKETKLPSGTKVKSTKKSAEKALKKQKKKIESTEKFKKKYVDTEFGRVNVYVSDSFDQDFKLIDNTIEEIKQSSRTVCNDSYSSNNVYLILQDALKKVKLADK